MKFKSLKELQNIDSINYGEVEEVDLEVPTDDDLAWEPVIIHDTEPEPDEVEPEYDPFALITPSPSDNGQKIIDVYQDIDDPLEAIYTLKESAKAVDPELVTMISAYCTTMAACSEMKSAAMIKEYRTAMDSAIKVIETRRKEKIEFDEADVLVEELQRLNSVMNAPTPEVKVVIEDNRE